MPENSHPTTETTGVTILTNMTFWQSQVWMRAVDSIYPDHGRNIEHERPVWRQAWTLFRRRRHYDVVLTMGVRESMAYGFFCLITGTRSKQVMPEVFIDDHAGGWLWKIKNRIYGVIARRALGILTNSSTERQTMAERYDMEEDKLRYVPLNSTLSGESRSTIDEGFILSAGRTLRDYPTLIDAVKNLDCRVIIICGHDDAFGESLPPHITVLREVSFAQYVDYIKRCALMAVPLRDTERATGQVVMLDAMAIGKPVVVTRSPGTIDYIEDGRNGILVEPGNAAQLRSALEELLSSPERRRQLGDEAYRDINTHYSFDVHARLKLQAICDFHAQ